MRNLVVTEFITLDGVVEDPGGSEKFERGGWGFEFERGPEGDKFKLDETRETDALLLGRKTYEGFAAAWPLREGEFADLFNNMKKYVISKTLPYPTWNNTTVLRGDVAEEVSKLKALPGGMIQVPGSVQLVNALLQHNLVDELRLMVYPVILGKGKRLFYNDNKKQAIRLVESRPVGDSILIQIYHPERKG